MDISRKLEMERLHIEQKELFDSHVLNLLNGQFMYEEFKENNIMGESDSAPFNEAMCVNATTERIFEQDFIRTRASGHHETEETYIKKVIEPLQNLIDKHRYESIVLWFGEDMFCQMNLLTILAYLEQSGYEGKVILSSFREDEFRTSQTEIRLGHYLDVYKEVLVMHTRPSYELLPVMYQAIEIYLDMLNEDNAVTRYIAKNKELIESELLHQLFELFPAVGYGDTQYAELIHKVK